GIKAEINDLFLNCDELRYEDELVRASFFIDELTDWGADIIVIFNNQAAYSMLKCDNPRLRNIPVVFSGVYHPDRELIGQFPNVTGFSDIPDFVSTIRMIENMMGKSRIVVMSGSGMIDKQMWENLDTQCKEAGIETYEGDVFEHILAHRVVRNAYLEEKDELINEEIDTTVVMRLMSEAMPLRTIQQTARGSETYLMLTSRTYNSMDAQEFFVNPSFAVINEGFGSNTKMLGGYFCPLESQMKHLAEGIALRL
ncbi:sensor histidine kinase, partial [Bacteroides stercoris]